MFVLSFGGIPMRPLFRLGRGGPNRTRQAAVTVPAPETFVLAALCLLDLSSTIWWVSYRNASEGNPLMAYYLLHGGTVAFALAKLVLMVMPLFIAEWARRLRPRFVHAALRVGIAGYLGLYALGVVQINQTEAEAAELADVSAPAPVFPARKWASPVVPGSGWNPAACGRTRVSIRVGQDEP